MYNREFIHSFENCWKHKERNGIYSLVKLNIVLVHCTILELEKLGIFLKSIDMRCYNLRVAYHVQCLSAIFFLNFIYFILNILLFQSFF